MACNIASDLPNWHAENSYLLFVYIIQQYINSGVETPYKELQC